MNTYLTSQDIKAAAHALELTGARAMAQRLRHILATSVGDSRETLIVLAPTTLEGEFVQPVWTAEMADD